MLKEKSIQQRNENEEKTVKIAEIEKMLKEKIEKLLEEISQLEKENKKLKDEKSQLNTRHKVKIEELMVEIDEKDAEIAHVRKEALKAIEELQKSHEKEIKEYKHATQLLGSEKQALLSEDCQLQTHLEQLRMNKMNHIHNDDNGSDIDHDILDSDNNNNNNKHSNNNTNSSNSNPSLNDENEHSNNNNNRRMNHRSTIIIHNNNDNNINNNDNNRSPSEEDGDLDLKGTGFTERDFEPYNDNGSSNSDSNDNNEKENGSDVKRRRENDSEHEREPQPFSPNSNISNDGNDTDTPTNLQSMDSNINSIKRHRETIEEKVQDLDDISVELMNLQKSLSHKKNNMQNRLLLLEEENASLKNELNIRLNVEISVPRFELLVIEDALQQKIVQNIDLYVSQSNMDRDLIKLSDYNEINCRLTDDYNMFWNAQMNYAKEVEKIVEKNLSLKEEIFTQNETINQVKKERNEYLKRYSLPLMPNIKTIQSYANFLDEEHKNSILNSLRNTNININNDRKDTVQNENENEEDTIAIATVTTTATTTQQNNENGNSDSISNNKDDGGGNSSSNGIDVNHEAGFSSAGVSSINVETN